VTEAYLKTISCDEADQVRRRRGRKGNKSDEFAIKGFASSGMELEVEGKKLKNSSRNPRRETGEVGMLEAEEGDLLFQGET